MHMMRVVAVAADVVDESRRRRRRCLRKQLQMHMKAQRKMTGPCRHACSASVPWPSIHLRRRAVDPGAAGYDGLGYDGLGYDGVLKSPL